jgi:hypothetical protein
VAVVRDDDAAQPAEVVILQVNSDRGRIGVKPVPYEFRDGSDWLRLCLALQEIGLNFDGVIGHQNFTSASDVATSKLVPSMCPSFAFIPVDSLATLRTRR